MTWLFYILYLGTIALLLVGAQLQVLKSALVCPDWPLCFGEFLPLYTTPAFYESLHRFLAGIVGALSVIWGISLYKRIGPKAFLPLFLVILQSLLGWATFVYKLPTITTVLHLIFSLLFMASLEGTRPLVFDESLKNRWNPRLKDGVGFFLFFLVLQIVLGGILRKSSLLASCESSMSFLACWQKQAEIPLAGSLAIIHRFLGLLTTITGFFIFSSLMVKLPRWKGAAFLGLVLMVGQLLIGLSMGRSSSRELIIWHFALAVFSFLVLVYLLVRLRRHEYHFFGRPVPTFLNDLIDLFKPRLTILVVITVLVGVLLTPLQPNLIYLLLALLAIWFQAAGALSLNCYLEREADKYMERTKDRPLPAGRLHPMVAVYWGWGLIFLGSGMLVLLANILTAGLGLFAALSYLYIYTPLKLKTPYSLYLGAIPGALPPLMGYTVVTGQIDGPGAYLFGILFLWQIPHFMAISLYRKEEYGSAHFITFAQTHSAFFLKMNISLYSIFLMIFGLLPTLWQWRDQGYLTASLLIGVMLVGISLGGWLTKSPQSLSRWARVYFFGTLFYLPMQLGVLLILR
jgi:heme o synthase